MKLRLIKCRFLIMSLFFFYFYFNGIAFGQYPHLFPCVTKDIPEFREITLSVDTSKVRIIKTYPKDVVANSNKVLDNFECQVVSTNQNLIKTIIDTSVIIEEYPFSEFTVTRNKRFGSQLAGQVNELLAPYKYRNFDDFAKRQEKIIQIQALAGVGTIRDLHSYGTKRYIIETSKGRYNFSNADFMTSLASKYQIEIISRLSPHYGKPLRLPNGLPLEMQAYKRYIKKTVERYDGDNDFGCDFPAPDCYARGDGQYPDCQGNPEHWAQTHRIKYWETLKEPEPGRRNRVGNDPGLSPQDSTELLRISYETIKSVDKDAVVYFSGMGPVLRRGPRISMTERENAQISYFNKMLALGAAKYFDVLGFDAYTEDLVMKAKKYQDVARQFDYLAPLWIGQIGAVDRKSRRPYPHGGSHKKQSEFLVKSYTRAFAKGIERVLWGDFQDNSRAEAVKRHSLMDPVGLFYTETWELKPAYFTYKLMATALLDFVRVEMVSSNIYKFYFRERSPIYIAWP